MLKSSYREQALSSLENQSKQIAINIDNKLDYYQNYANTLLFNKNLIFAAENNSYPVVEHVLADETVHFMHQNIGSISEIRLYRNGIYTKAGGYNKVENILEQNETDNPAYASNSLWTGVYLNARNEKVFSLFQRFYQTNQEREYILEICIYESEISGFINKHDIANRITS